MRQGRKTSSRRAATTTQSEGELPPRWQWLPTMCDVWFIAILNVAPLVMGGRHPLGKLVYLLFVALFASTHILERAMRRNRAWYLTGVEWILATATGIVLLQIVSLPGGLLQQLSPSHLMLPQWSVGLAHALGQASWSRLSLTPYETGLGLGVLLAHAALFLVLYQRFRDLDRITSALQVVALASLGMAVLGLVQYLSGTERFVWIFQHESRLANTDVCGPFENSNHFVHFLALGIGPIILWTQRFQRRVIAGPTGNTFRGEASSSHRFLVVGLLAGATLIFAGLLAHSRGGMLVMGLAAVVSTSAFICTGLLTRKALIGLATIGVVVLAGLALHGYESVRQEVASLTAGSLESIDREGARRKIWQANLESARHFPMLGTGVGSHIEIYPRFFDQATVIQYTHAESGYLQVLTETGVVGFGLLLVALGYGFLWCQQSIRWGDERVRSVAIAAATGLLVSAVHSIFDFPWYLPACASMAITLAAMVASLARQHIDVASETEASALSLPPWICAVGVLVLLGFVVQFAGPAIAEQHFTRYRRVSKQSRREMRLWLTTTDQVRAEKLAATLRRNCVRMAEHLEGTLQHNPRHLRAHWRAAEIYLRLFEFSQQSSENAMGLPQIRDAALASKFASKEALDGWLQRAIGDSHQLLERALYHVQAAMEICPLQGRVYLYAADLAFLRGVPKAGSDELVAHALSVRPHDAAVLFTLGREAALLGGVETALNYWQRSFHLSPEYREAIINSVAGQMPVPIFVNHFEPDAEGLESLLRFYRSRKMMSNARMIAPFVIASLEEKSRQQSGVYAATQWHKCRDIYRFLGDDQGALKAAQSAVETAPNWYNGRLALANEWLANGDYEAALKELQWCARRRPGDARLRQQIQSAQTLLARNSVPSRRDQRSAQAVLANPH